MKVLATKEDIIVIDLGMKDRYVVYEFTSEESIIAEKLFIYPDHQEFEGRSILTHNGRLPPVLTGCNLTKKRKRFFFNDMFRLSGTLHLIKERPEVPKPTAKTALPVEDKSTETKSKVKPVEAKPKEIKSTKNPEKTTVNLVFNKAQRSEVNPHV